MLDVVVHAWNPSTQEAEAGEAQVQDQPGLQSKNLSQIRGNKELIMLWKRYHPWAQGRIRR
jgi:hypothetical protein